ncbi:Arm DNA-binding domain-containing protein [Lentzea albidocapillata]|uniref:Arm DNA-binding domain-containing protein n=1 Tax=Lentzea albidocapillata TaxID=40571 RepID=UPI0012F8A709|nr:Arm DNA-binding domain-containing protein [Lentzea albidocapillata]
MKNPNRGRVYRRCACRGADGRQLGARCPQLAYRKHGTWTFAVDLPTLDGKRRTRRRSGFVTKADAQTALWKVLEYERSGIVVDDRQTVADYLMSWLRGKASTLKPTTMANYWSVMLLCLLAVVVHELPDVLLGQADLGKDLVGGGGPLERSRVGVPVGDVVADLLDQHRDGAEGAAADGLAGSQRLLIHSFIRLLIMKLMIKRRSFNAHEKAR